MPKTPKKRVLILTVKWGHYSIAKAVEETLKRDCLTRVHLVDVEKFSDISYTTVYRLFPNLWNIPFKLSEREKIRKIANTYLKRAYFKILKESVESFKPDVVINVYFAFIPSLEQLVVNNNFFFLNVITNPRSFSRIEVSPKSYNLVFDRQARKLCKSFNIPEEKIVNSGWFVRREFQNKSNISYVHNLFKDKKMLTFCVVGGSDGAYNITKILPAFLNNTTPLQVIFICGNSRSLYNAVKTFSRITKNYNKKTKIVPLGYTQDIHNYLKASDLVIGKAGPNLLFEAVATQTPFLAISHIAGQEDGNLDIIKDNKLGFVEENPVKVARLLKKIIKNPKILKRFDNPLKKMAAYNLRSSKVLHQLFEEVD